MLARFEEGVEMGEKIRGTVVDSTAAVASVPLIATFFRLLARENK